MTEWKNKNYRDSIEIKVISLVTVWHHAMKMRLVDWHNEPQEHVIDRSRHITFLLIIVDVAVVMKKKKKRKAIDRPVCLVKDEILSPPSSPSPLFMTDDISLSLVRWSGEISPLLSSSIHVSKFHGRCPFSFVREERREMLIRSAFNGHI